MASLNDHIENYLNYYLDLRESPRFAVLLHGDWGCGKTWFIKNYIDHCKRADGTPQRFLYLTLYGVSEYSEIEDQIFQQIHPILSSKGMKLAGKILKGVVRASLKVDIDAHTTTTVTPDIGPLEIPPFLKRIDESVLVFDDLERCHMSVEKVLGYINGIVEHQGVRVIIVANETEMDRGTNESAGRDYRRIKEKLVGKSFRVNYDVRAAIAFFLDQIQGSDTKAYLTSRADRIVEMFARAGFRNLRHLHRAFLDFERFHGSVPEKYLKTQPLLDELLTLFLAFSFEIQAGKLAPPDIDGFRAALIARAVSGSEKDTSSPPIVVCATKYGFLNLYDLVLPESTWANFFGDGFVSKEEMGAGIANSSFGEHQAMPSWVTLWHYRDLEDEGFARALQDVEKKWENREYTDPGIVLHVSGLFLLLSATGLRTEGTVDAAAKCMTYIDDLATANVWKDQGASTSKDQRTIVRRSFDRDGYGGLGYAGMDLAQFREVCAHLDRRLEEAKAITMPDAAKRLLDLMVADTQRFCRTITISNSEDQVYCSIPIFQHLKPGDFVAALIGLTNEKKLMVGRALAERYRWADGRLVSEGEFLQQVAAEIKREVEPRRGKISGYLLECVILKTIESAVVVLPRRSIGEPTTSSGDTAFAADSSLP